MLLEQHTLTQFFSSSFDIPLSIACADEPLDTKQLLPSERGIYSSFTVESRATDWLKGRRALKQLLPESDTARLRFPNSLCSLTHSGNIAVAVAANCHSIRGIGIDLEFYRRVNPKTAKLFLSRDELGYLNELENNHAARELIRLWTIKEALFKSDPENESRWLSDYRLKNPSANRGVATIVQTAATIDYSCAPTGSGVLSIAVNPGGTLNDLR